MPSLIGNYVAANYRQQQVPFSRFGTRKIAWFKVGRADTNDGGVLDMETFNTLIDAIQTQAEIVTIGAPHRSDDWGKFMVAVFEDTASDGENTELAGSGDVGYNGNSKTLQQVLRDATGDSNIIVEKYFLAGAPTTGTTGYDGWSTEAQYQEYATKSEFLNESYLF